MAVVVMHLNLLGSSRRVFGLLRRPPSPRPGVVPDTRVEVWRRYVQLERDFPRPRTPVRKLHLPGYYATPERVAPLCSASGGPYGAVVWARRDRPLPLPLCPRCVSVAGKGLLPGIDSQRPCANEAGDRDETHLTTETT